MNEESRLRNPFLHDGGGLQNPHIIGCPLPPEQISNFNPNLLPQSNTSLVTPHPPAQLSTDNRILSCIPSDIMRELISSGIPSDILKVLIVVPCFIFLFFQAVKLSAPIPPSFSVSSAIVYPFNISSSSRLTATWNITISFKNPDNGIIVYYDRVQAAIYYGPHLLSEASILPIFLGRQETAIRHASMMVQSKLVDGVAAESMVRDLALHGAVDFRVGLLAWRRYYYFLGPREKEMIIRVSCENVTVGFLPSGLPGVLVGPPRNCNFSLG